MKVGEVMTVSPVTIREDTSIGDAWELLRTRDVRHLPVVNSDDELVGIVSDRDFATPPIPPLEAELLGAHSASLDAPVSTIMTGAPISADPEDDLEEAIAAMIENKVGAIPVVLPEGGVVGIISYLDVLRALRPAATSDLSVEP